VPEFIREPDVGLCERRRVVRAVAHHRDELPLGLLLADVRELGLRRRLRDVVVDPCLLRDGRRRERIVARDHDGAQAHAAKPLEPFLDAGLQDVLEHHEAGDLRTVRDDQRRVASPRHGLDLPRQVVGHRAPLPLHVAHDRVGGPPADP
jgi:hypothetical protein